MSFYAIATDLVNKIIDNECVAKSQIIGILTSNASVYAILQSDYLINV